MHKEKRVTRSSKSSRDNADGGKDTGETDNITEEPLLPYEIKGSAQHAGQLLLETKHSLFLFSKTSIGIMFTETKVSFYIHWYTVNLEIKACIYYCELEIPGQIAVFN